MSKNYYPQMMDEISRKDVSQQEILDWFYRHKPHSVIEAVQAVRNAKKPSKAEIDRFEKHYAPTKPAPLFSDRFYREKESQNAI